jgi:hypothetical protein
MAAQHISRSCNDTYPALSARADAQAQAQPAPESGAATQPAPTIHAIDDALAHLPEAPVHGPPLRTTAIALGSGKALPVATHAETREDLWQLRCRAALAGDSQAYEAAADRDPMLKDLTPAGERMDIVLGQSELDLAIRAGSARWTRRLREAGVVASEWSGLDAGALEALPDIVSAQNETCLRQAIGRSGMRLQALLQADQGMALLYLATRIGSEDLARQWLNAHPERVDPAFAGAQSDSVLLPAIQAGSIRIIRLLLDAGARPKAREVLQADGELRELLERAYARQCGKEDG